MAGNDDEREAIIDALRVAVARAETLCARAKIARRFAQEVRALSVRKKVTASRVLSARGAERLRHNLEEVSRDLAVLRTRIESANHATRTLRWRTRR